MKVLGSVLAALFLLTTPAVAVEYQGQSIDGKKLDAKAYYYATGGVYDVQVRFDKTRATIYFSDGNQTTDISEQIFLASGRARVWWLLGDAHNREFLAPLFKGGWGDQKTIG